MKKVYFRFYEELNEYILPERRKVWFEYQFVENIPLKIVLLSMQIPLTQIDLVLVNGKSESPDYILQNNDRISVFPVFETFDISTVSKIKDSPLRELKFICDVHLGRLCKDLRLLGFDTLFSDTYSITQLIEISVNEQRILLSKNQKLKINKNLTRFYWIRSSDSKEQIRDVVQRLQLNKCSNPLSLCLKCNTKILPVEKANIAHKLPGKIIDFFNEFFQCPVCRRIYWKGSHFERMQSVAQQLLQ